MRSIHAVLPDDIADAVEAEARDRSDKAGFRVPVTAVLRDVIVPAFRERAAILSAAKPPKRKEGAGK